MLIYGHRGASATEPENTLRSFQRAIAMGANGLEFDVQVTADRVPVVIHDRTLGRTTNGTGNVDECLLEQLQKLDAGSGERIPTFAETLEAIGDRVHLDIEVKQSGIERETLDVLRGFPGARWAISSFDWETLRVIRGLDAQAELWLLAVNVSDAVLDAAKQISASGVALYAASLDADGAERLRVAGLKIVVWTVNDVQTARRCQALGVFGLCTDVPDVILAGLG